MSALKIIKAGIDLTPQHAAQLAQKGGAAVATGGGLWVWLAENAQAIGVVCAMIGAAVAVGGFAVNWYYRHKESKRPGA